MKNEIRNLRITRLRSDPSRAEVWFSVSPTFIDSATEIRGSLTGPRSPYAATVEVAYPLRQVSTQQPNPEELLVRVIVPEPCFWEPKAPFVYEARVELWQNGVLEDLARTNQGLRSIRLAQDGLKLNGQPLPIQGDARVDLNEEIARTLRQQGFNTVMCPMSDATAEVWKIAQKLGIFLLGADFGKIEDIRQAIKLRHYACSLGWLFLPEQLEMSLAAIPGWPAMMKENTLLGVELSVLPSQPLPTCVNVVACQESSFSALASLPYPKIILGPCTIPLESFRNHRILGYLE
jgi:hypothetical protein